MKRKKPTKNQNDSPLRGFRMTGRITFEDIPYELMLSKTGEIAFARNGQWIEDPDLQNRLMEYLLEANQES